MTIEQQTQLAPSLGAERRIVRPKNAPRALFEAAMVKRALKEALLKLDPRLVAKNPVMFVVSAARSPRTSGSGA